MIFDNPTSCKLARWMSALILFAITCAALAFAVESLPVFRVEVRVASSVVVWVGPPVSLTQGRDVAPQVDQGGSRHPAFVWIEVSTIILFTIEYLVRLCTAWSVPAIYLVSRDHLRVWHESLVQSNMGAQEDDEEEAKPVNKLDGLGLSTRNRIKSHREEYPVVLEKRVGRARRAWLFVKNFENVLDLIAIAPFYIEVCGVALGSGVGCGCGCAFGFGVPLTQPHVLSDRCC